MNYRFEIEESLEMDEQLPENGYAKVEVEEDGYSHCVGLSNGEDEWIEYRSDIYDVLECQRDDVNFLMKELFGR
jgi:hypothetical protein